MAVPRLRRAGSYASGVPQQPRQRTTSVNKTASTLRVGGHDDASSAELQASSDVADGDDFAEHRIGCGDLGELVEVGHSLRVLQPGGEGFDALPLGVVDS